MNQASPQVAVSYRRGVEQKKHAICSVTPASPAAGQGLSYRVARSVE